MTSALDASEENARLETLDFFQSCLRSSNRAFVASSPIRVVSQGDSWTDYTPGNDLIKSLKRSGFSINNFGTGGDTLENMLFGSKYRERNWTRLPCEHTEVLEAVKNDSPRFFIFSGCGNDIAGDEFASYLNHKDSEEGRIDVVRVDYTNYMINKVFRGGYEKLIETVQAVDPEIDILIHGYGYTVPTGKGVINLPGAHFIGPWLKPALVSKNITDPNEQYQTVKRQIDTFNDMLADIAAKSHGKVHHIDLRPYLRPLDWANELHLNRPGFDKAAGFFKEKMRSLMTPAENNTLDLYEEAVKKFLAGDDSEMVSLLSTL